MEHEKNERVVWVVIRADEPGHGEWFVRAREASLKATWLRETWKANVTVVRAVLDDANPGPASRRGPSRRPA